MSNRKLVSTILVLMLAVAMVFTGCTADKGGATAAPVASATPKGTEAAAAGNPLVDGMADKTPITFSYFVRDNGRPAESSNRVIKKIEELTGVHIEFEFLVGELPQKLGVMLAGEDYTDLIFIGGDAPQLLNSGAGIDLTNYIKNAPNLNYLINEYNPTWAKRNVFKDGKVYVMDTGGYQIGPETKQEHNNNAHWLQKEVLSSQGYPAIPKTIEEYFGLIESYYAKNPTIDGTQTIPFEMFLGRGYGNALLSWAGYPNDANYSLMADQNDYTKDEGIPVYSKYNKPYLEYLNKMYLKGLIAPDTFTLTQDQFFARVSTGSILGMYREKWFFNTPVQTLKSEGKDNRTYVPVPILYDPNTMQDNNLDPVTVTGNNGVIISKKCKDPQRAIDYMNFLLEEPVAELLAWGEEGVDYSKDDKGLFTRNDEQYKNWSNNDWLRDNTGYLLRNYTPKRMGTYTDGNCCNWQEQPSVWYSKLSQYDKDFLKAYKKDNFLQFLRTDNLVRAAYYPTWGNIILEKDSPEAMVEQKLNQINNEWVPQVVAAKEGEFETVFQKYWDEMTKANPQILIDAYRKAAKDLDAKING